MKRLLAYWNSQKEFLISFFDLNSYARLIEFLDTMPHEEKIACTKVLKNIKVLKE